MYYLPASFNKYCPVQPLKHGFFWLIQHFFLPECVNVHINVVYKQGVVFGNYFEPLSPSPSKQSLTRWEVYLHRTHAMIIIELQYDQGHNKCYHDYHLLDYHINRDKTCLTTKQTLRSLSLSYQKKDGRVYPSFWYATDFLEFESFDFIDHIL